MENEESKFFGLGLNPESEDYEYPEKSDLDGNSVDDFINNNYNCKDIPDGEYISDDSLKDFLQNLNNDLIEEQEENKEDLTQAPPGNYLENDIQISTLLNANDQLNLKKQVSIGKYLKNSRKIERIKK